MASLVTIRNSFEDPESCGSSDSFQAENTDKRAYWECMEQVFGPEPTQKTGPSCEHDLDCPRSSICSTMSNRCLIPIAGNSINPASPPERPNHVVTFDAKM